MRIMCLDVGEKTLGVAVSDALELAAHGVTTIRRVGYAKDLTALKGYLEEYEVEELVVGLPKSMDGSIGTQAEKVMAFVEKLKKDLSVPIVLYDERLSTALAQKALIEGDVSRAKRRKVIDMLAAQVILQGYLDRRSRGLSF